MYKRQVIISVIGPKVYDSLVSSVFTASSDASLDVDISTFAEKKSCPELSPLLKVSSQNISTLEWPPSNNLVLEMILDMQSNGVPILIRKMPRDMLGIFNVDLLKLAKCVLIF